MGFLWFYIEGHKIQLGFLFSMVFLPSCSTWGWSWWNFKKLHLNPRCIRMARKMFTPRKGSNHPALLHPVNLRTTRASSNETASESTKSWYRLPFCQTLSLKPPNYTSNHGFRSSEWWDIMRCPMVFMEETVRLRNAHMVPSTMNQRSPHVATHFCSHPPVFDSVLGNSISRPRRSKTLCPGGREATLRFLSQAVCCLFEVVFIPHSRANTLSNLKMTRKLCIISELSCSLLSCAYQNCMSMAKLCKIIFKQKNVDPSVCMCVCLSV